ncbi:hypothetical protein HHK36_019641 [Tetracentron sinense]|uniref:Myb/SANT-like DNA-binding domain-containing protein n=1 Tax=Tetracentron sinense TaxID=13715 RepID=A0A834Z1P9_TETSI|nr:hypothetical protein HHK36_019641 [Tetracentron sinense]
MEREASQITSSLINNSIKKESLRKPLAVACGGDGGGGSCGSDRLKRDEWSDGAVSSLLDAYESKWVLRNRAKLKGHDWEDVARDVSSRSNSTKSPKTLTQCKNKIESMKKRYRSESATADASSWPFFPRLDLLLCCRTPNPPTQPTLMLQNKTLPRPVLQIPAPPPIGIQQDSQESNGVERVAKKDGVETKLLDHVSDKNPMEMDSSTRISHDDKDTLKSKKKMKMERKKRQRKEHWEVAESVRWLAEVVVRSERARTDTMMELERIRVEAESKKGEMDLKRTEIIANTQLQIARLLAGNGRGTDSSLRIGRN